MTVTDNGANFVKAFSTFGEDKHAMPEDIQTHLVQEEIGEIAFVEVGPILDDETSAELGYVLPPHQRCAAHTMNLIAVKDAKSACRDGAYKKVSKAALGKFAGLWNKASRNAVAAEAVHDAMKFSLVVPNATRWNSYYHSVDKICEIFRRHLKKTLNNVCTAVGVALFRPVYISFILEYVKVMQPITQALDVLQSETHCCMGILLPSLVSLKRQLRLVREGLKLASPLVDALLTGIEKRFDEYFARDDLILASIIHPEFLFDGLRKTQKPRTELDRYCSKQ